MNSKSTVFLTSAFVCAFSVPSVAHSQSDWSDVKNPKEIRALLANNSLTNSWGTVWSFRADGKALAVNQSGGRTQHTWNVKGNDQACATPPMAGAGECWRIQRSRHDQSKLRFVYSDGMGVAMTVKAGVPSF